ncbi:helix-turn-helix transcriptional regulator [Halobacillus sp. GSS1]|uniref:ArsR/SmtB family transcription factor n=1 Tax=Halobacillus sp. GSS1 TaxID=2815919 RepID=UPI001A8C80EE|nr:helix-turn-helix domain-containing protein [Halobacillus sp. GSS1]MBN9653419.1 helix-turn-helix transcriptional regulator [Halobacillus sp. GSS1]
MTFKQSKADENRVKVLKALADVKRIDILRFIYHSKNHYTCGGVQEALSLNKSNQSYHLKILQEANLIELQRQGQSKVVIIKEETFEEFIPGFLATL